MNVVVVAGERIAVLEVSPDRGTGAVMHADRTTWAIERLPGAGEWWVRDADGAELAMVARTTLVRERFLLHLRDEPVEVRRVSSAWRRRWSVVDGVGRELLEVTQRPLTRSVHDLRRRSGDVPAELPLVVGWVLALATSDPMPAVRRRVWTGRVTP